MMICNLAFSTSGYQLYAVSVNVLLLLLLLMMMIAVSAEDDGIKCFSSCCNTL